MPLSDSPRDLQVVGGGTSDLVLLDSSAALALVNPDDPRADRVAGRIANRRCGLAGHAEFEVYSVLTRLPGPSRLSSAEALTFVREAFPHTVHPDPERLGRAVARFVDAGVAGGAVFDGLVALAADAADAVLLSCDRRATRTYLALGVRFEIVEAG